MLVRVLITGVNGFAGKHLARHLAGTAELHGAQLEMPGKNVVYTPHQLDLTDTDAVRALIDTVRPEQIYHLAALSSPAESLKAPWETIHNNTRAQHNIIQACIDLKWMPRILIVTSGDIYAPASVPLDENSLIVPANPYAASKIAQDMMAYQASFTLPVLRARPFNHTGPGQREGFVAPDFAMQIARIEAGLQEPIVRVRNLLPQVDFTDVRDVVAAYRLIMEHGEPGDVYNIASGTAYSVQHLLDTLVESSNLTVRPQVIPTGPQLPTTKLGDAARLRARTGWRPTIPFSQTLLDLLNDCRSRLAHSAH